MMTLQELSDRREIDDLLIAYCHAIDRHDWDALDDVFSDDAHIDYTAFGGPAGTLAEMKVFLDQSLPMFAYKQHIISASQIKLDGDRATGRTYCSNPMGMRGEDGKMTDMMFALWYVDELVRTPKGWRISKRSEEVSHTIGFPSAGDGEGAQAA